MKESSTHTGQGAALLGILFIALKLCHVIDWSWWWVLAPFWIPLALAIVVIFGIVVVAGFRGER